MPITAEELLSKLSEPQRIFLTSLTDERIRHLASAAEFFSEIDDDVISIAHAFGKPEWKELRKFFWQCKPETLEFLSDLREEELDELRGSIETYIAIKRTMRVIRWAAATLSAAFVGMMLVWEKFAALLCGGAPK